MNPLPVIPAKSGIQADSLPIADGRWIPTFAAMTGMGGAGE
jgi:hypothetical protein